MAPPRLVLIPPLLAVSAPLPWAWASTTVMPARVTPKGVGSPGRAFSARVSIAAVCGPVSTGAGCSSTVWDRPGSTAASRNPLEIVARTRPLRRGDLTALVAMPRPSPEDKMAGKSNPCL